jgi:predicted Zn-dependent peptidase
MYQCGKMKTQRTHWFHAHFLNTYYLKVLKTSKEENGLNHVAEPTMPNTNEDRTYYYEVFPSNNLELGLWMESERMLHPIINQIGVDTQNE